MSDIVRPSRKVRIRTRPGHLRYRIREVRKIRTVSDWNPDPRFQVSEPTGSWHSINLLSSHRGDNRHQIVTSTEFRRTYPRNNPFLSLSYLRSSVSRGALQSVIRRPLTWRVQSRSHRCYTVILDQWFSTFLKLPPSWKAKYFSTPPPPLH